MSAAAQPLHNSTDPTATKTLREREFRPALTRRFRALKGAIRQTVGYEENFLGLGSNGDRPRIGTLRASDNAYSSHELVAAVDDVDAVGDAAYRVKRERGAIPAFNEWLSEQISTGVLVETPNGLVRNGEHYTAPYIRSAGNRGWTDAGRRLQRAGVDIDTLDGSFDRPIAKRQLRDLYARTYRDLEKITRDLEREIREELTRGLAKGENPRKMARRLNARVDVSISRSERLARTEVIRSYNEEALTRYQDSGISTVAAEVEFLTAGDRRVCPTCASLEGNTYSITQARGLIPIHPNCRCTFVPVVETFDTAMT